MVPVERCAECGYEYALGLAVSAADEVVRLADEIGSSLGANAADLIARPAPATWSPLEYGCHVRDVLLVQRERVLAARRTERPSFEPMGRDERVDHDGYADQAPADVSRQLTEAARLFANVLRRLAAADWDRTVVYNYPTQRERSLRWVAVHTVHELYHHLDDIRRQLH